MKEFKIKNYTTSISASRTIGEIEDMLAQIGADAIMKNYRGDGRVEALSFHFQKRGYKLPSNTEKCYQILFGNKGGSKQSQEEQAERIAWRVIKDWLHAQLSLIKIGQAEVEQVMLPYMWDGKESLYDKLKGSNFAALGSSKE